MAEKKQYLSQKLESGTMLISEFVLETIVVNAINEVEGFAGFASRPSVDVIKTIGKKYSGKPMKITIDSCNELHVFCNINVLYGRNVLDVANSSQVAIRNALLSATGVSVAELNVNVCGIVQK